MIRSSGVLMPMSSLPSPYGIGGMGRSAYAFVDFLKAAGQPAKKVLTPEKTGEGAKVTLTLAPNALVRLRVVPVERSSDPGYEYGWYCKE